MNGNSRIHDEVERLYSQLNRDLDATVRIALVGSGGVGKSSLVNALVGREICAVGVETDTTVKAQIVEHQNVTFVDLPGFGTTRFPPDAFTDHFSVDDYDLFLCVTNNKFSAASEDFFRKYLGGDAPAILVRTHLDALKQRGRTRTELQRDLRAEVVRKFGKETPFHFVDSIEREGVEELQSAVYARLAAAKRARWVMSAGVLWGDMLKRKAELAERIVWQSAAAAAANALNPVPGVDVAVDLGVLLKMGQRICEVYGIDTETVAYYERMAGPLSAIAKRVAQLIGRDALLALLKRYAGRQVFKQASKYAPLVGQAVAASLGFSIAKLAGDHLQRECHALATAIMEARFGEAPDLPEPTDSLEHTA